MGLLHWLLAASAASIVQASNSLRTFENTNIQRTIELGGSLTHVTTTYAFKALGSLGPNVYTLALSDLDDTRTSWFDVKLKGSTENVKVEKYGFNPKRCVGLIARLRLFYGYGMWTCMLTFMLQLDTAMPIYIPSSYRPWQRMRLPRLSLIPFLHTPLSHSQLL